MVQLIRNKIVTTSGSHGVCFTYIKSIRVGEGAERREGEGAGEGGRESTKLIVSTLWSSDLGPDLFLPTRVHEYPVHPLHPKGLMGREGGGRRTTLK